MSEVNELANTRLEVAIGHFLKKLENIPGWRDLKSSHLKIAIDLDDIFSEDSDKIRPFELPVEIELQRMVVSRYIELCELVASVKTLEYYFRRFPFKDQPVTRHEHLSNICELYFNRMYQFKERFKKLTDAVAMLIPNHGIQFGETINQFTKEFNQEIKERHLIHHDAKFSDLDIDRVFIAQLFDTKFPNKRWKADQVRYYARVAKNWAQRVRKRGARLDDFVEAIAKVLIQKCSFLDEQR